MNIDKLLERIADVALRDQLRRQIEIQNETIGNLNELVSSQKDKIARLEAQIEYLKKQAGSGPSASKSDLFESDGILWKAETFGDQKTYRPHCPQCMSPLNRIADFLECNKCGFNEIVSARKPSNISEQ